LVVLLAIPFVAAKAQLSGTYTIGGTSPSYASFAAAVSALTTSGVSGPVVFNVRAGTYTEQINIPSITGSSGSNTITFKSENGTASSVILQFAATGLSTNYVIGLTGTSYIRILNMTLSSTGAGSSYRNVIRIDGTTTSVGDVVIQGNTLSGYVGSSSSGDLSLVYAVSPSRLSNISILNNTFNLGAYGLVIYGNGSQPGSGVVIRGNTLSNGNGYGGIYLSSLSAPVIDSNTVTVTSDGIDLNSCGNASGIDQLLVQRNRVVVSGSGWAMQINNSSGNASYSGLVANNFVSGSGSSNGIYLSSSSYINVFYNSVNLTSSASSYTFYQSGGTGQNVENNIFMNNGGGYAFYVATPGGITLSDYNDFYTTGANLAYWNGNQANLAALQSTSSTNAHSFFYSAAFVSPTDLHLAAASLGARQLLGTPVVGITTDIDGNPRSGTKPYMGANEGSTPLAVETQGADTKNRVELAPQKYELLQNYPNPFNPTTEVKFSVESAGRTTVTLYNTLGERVATLFDDVAQPGQYYRVTVSGNGLASGAYFYSIKSGNYTAVKRMLLLK
jgi:parallel beta-helix repeat protein